MVTLAISGEVTPGAILTKCGLWGDMVDVITYAIFRDCRLRGMGVVRGVSLPSPIDLTRRPYNTGHTVPCDRVITGSILQCNIWAVGRAQEDIHAWKWTKSGTKIQFSGFDSQNLGKIVHTRKRLNAFLARNEAFWSLVQIGRTVWSTVYLP